MSQRRVSESVRHLYGLSPEEFIAARDRLAGELKDAGKADEAAEVKKLRRPSIVAWAVNAASRQLPEEVAALREAGQALRRAQRKALSGGGGEDLRRATDDRRALIATLADAGVGAIGARGGAHRDAIAETFDAASVDDELGERLQAGILEREARPTAGFGAIEGFEVLQGGGSEDDERAVEEDPAEVRRERAREAREAEQRAVAAERAADKALRRADELKEKAAAAVTATREAESAAKRLSDEAKTERKRADRAAKAAESTG